MPAAAMWQKWKRTGDIAGKPAKMANTLTNVSVERALSKSQLGACYRQSSSRVWQQPQHLKGRR